MMDQPAAFDQLQRHLQSKVAKPTFDEWYSHRNGGVSFDHNYMQFGMPIEFAMRALSRLLREYVSEMAR